MSEPLDRDWYEAAIQAIEQLDSPDARELLEVYADVLQAAGDPRGTLAALQLQEIDNGKAADAWLAEHREQIFGYLAELVRKPPVYERWHGGWLTDLEIAPSRSRPEPVPELAALLRLPVCACLRHLHAPQQEWPNRPDLRCRASLRTLSIFGRSEAELELGELPRLEELTLTGCPRSLAIEAPNLRWLRFVDTPPYEICSFLASPLPTERLSVELRWIPLTSAHELRELLHHPAIGRLRELNLGVEEYPFDDVAIIPPVPPEWINEILAAPLLRQLEVRSFSLAYWQEQAKRLVDGFASAPGRTWVAADLTNYSPSEPAPPAQVAGVWQRLRGWFTRP
jgi:hypothetical protein